MTIRYRRAPGTLRLERVPDADLAGVALAQELAALERQAGAVRAATLDVRQRAHRLKLGLLADHARRLAFTPERPPADPAAPPPLTCAPADVRRARELVGVVQRDLAALLRISRSSVAEAERGRRRVLPVLADWTLRTLRVKGGNPP